MVTKYYTIKEVSQIIGVKPHVLRYWEKEFKILRPRKNTAGRRIYSEKDINIVKEIYRLLYVEKYSIKGAKKKIEEKIKKSSSNTNNIKEMVLEELKKIRDILKKT